MTSDPVITFASTRVALSLMTTSWKVHRTDSNHAISNKTNTTKTYWTLNYEPNISIHRWFKTKGIFASSVFGSNDYLGNSCGETDVSIRRSNLLAIIATSVMAPGIIFNKRYVIFIVFFIWWLRAFVSLVRLFKCFFVDAPRCSWLSSLDPLSVFNTLRRILKCQFWSLLENELKKKRTNHFVMSP